MDTRGTYVEARGDRLNNLVEATRNKVHRPPFAVEATHQFLSLRSRRAPPATMRGGC
jgi:hypothetical protein